MPEPVTVWMVHLRSGRASDEVKGVLALHSDALVFTHALGEGVTRFPLTHAQRVRRNRGTPILMLAWTEGSMKRTTAFYFVRPPPLDPQARGGVEDVSVSSLPRPGLGGMRKPSKRRQLKHNASYLTSQATTLKPVVQAWADELRPLLGD